MRKPHYQRDARWIASDAGRVASSCGCASHCTTVPSIDSIIPSGMMGAPLPCWHRGCFATSRHSMRFPSRVASSAASTAASCCSVRRSLLASRLRRPRLRRAAAAAATAATTAAAAAAADDDDDGDDQPAP